MHFQSSCYTKRGGGLCIKPSFEFPLGVAEPWRRLFVVKYNNKLTPRLCNRRSLWRARKIAGGPKSGWLQILGISLLL